MVEQLIFDLPPKTAFGREDFFVTGANDMAVRVIEDWQRWPLSKLVLCGPRGSGKTHLAHIWAEEVGAIVVGANALAYERLETLAEQPIVVEDAHKLAQNEAGEAALFHLHNLMQQAQHPLLMTGVGRIGEWGIILPDLLSRLSGTQTTHLSPPDDAMLSVLLVKLFSDRQLSVDPNLIPFILKRMERSFAAAGELVRKLDRASLENKKPIGKRMVAHVLDQIENG